MQLPKKYKTVIQERGLDLGHHELNNAELHLLALARKNFQVRAKHAALRHTDAVWNKHSEARKKTGAVPDFDALHAQWEMQLSSARAEMKQRTPSTKVVTFTSSDAVSNLVRSTHWQTDTKCAPCGRAITSINADVSAGLQLQQRDTDAAGGACGSS